MAAGARSNVAVAWSSSPASACACASQNVQTRKVPFAMRRYAKIPPAWPARPSRPVAVTRPNVLRVDGHFLMAHGHVFQVSGRSLPDALERGMTTYCEVVMQLSRREGARVDE